MYSQFLIINFYWYFVMRYLYKIMWKSKKCHDFTAVFSHKKSAKNQ
jgi:hypothetical protein